MPSVMAGRAERDAVRRLIAQRGVFRPRLQMVRVQFAASLRAAILTRPVVAIHDCRAESLVKRVAVVSGSRWPRSAPPVRMRRPDQMVVARRLNPCFSQPVADCRSVVGGERFAAQGLSNFAPLLGGQRSACGRRFSLSGSGNPRPSRLRFCRVARKVPRHRATRARAELQTAPNVRLAALVAGSSVILRHSFNHSGKVA